MRHESHCRKLHIVYHLLGLQVLGCVYPDSQFYVHQCKPGELQNLSGKPFLKLYHQSSQHAKYSFALQTSTHSAKLHLKRIFLCFLKNNLCAGSWIFLRNFFICCLSLEDQMKWAVQKAKKDLERATKFQVALEDELHSNKQGLPFLRCHCLGYAMHVHSLCLPFLTSHANLQFFGPRYVMHVDSLCLPFFTSHANLQFARVVFPRTLSDVFEFIRGFL